MKYKYIILLALLFVFMSCDDFLNTKSQKGIISDDIWKTQKLAEAYMYDIYFTFQDAGFTEELLASATDETLFTHGREFRETNSGAMTDVNLGWFKKTASGHQWERMYKNIRSCNDFIENVDNAEFEEPEKGALAKIQLKGEAYFLRAYFYHRLTRAFGGVPLQLEVTYLGQATYQMARSTYTECIDRILLDIKEAEELLKDRTFANTPKGRATLAAVKALKVRVLTDAASDLHDGPTASAKSSLLAGYKNPELIFYTNGTRAQRWEAARAAAKDLMDNPVGHGLNNFGGEGLSLQDKSEAIWQFFTHDTEESIFSRYFINTKPGESGTQMAKFNGPCGYHAWGGNTPVQDFVDAFLMADGTKFDWKNPAHKAAPYKNREPRFYASVMYDGMQWIKRIEHAKKDPAGQIQTGYYQMDPSQKFGDEKNGYYAGLDSRSGLADTWNGTYTGYYLKKFIHPRDGDHRNQIDSQFPFLRFSEVVYGYIEACIELNQLDEAIAKFNLMRKRVGLPNIPAGTNQADLRAMYQNDRRVELSLEEHRYWDLRRWMIAPDAPGITSLQGIQVKAHLKPGKGKQEIYKYDEDTWTYEYDPISVNVESRRWVDKSYYIPIMRNEMHSNLLLIQNPGY